MDPRRRIMEAALQLFDQAGYNGTGMEDIRKAAGFSTKSSLYAHFAGKEDLARAIFMDIVAAEHEAIRHALSEANESAWDRLLNMAKILTQWGLNHRVAYRFCFVRQHHHRFLRDAELQSAIKEGKLIAEQLLQNARDEGEPIRLWPNKVLIGYCQAIINHAIVDEPEILNEDAIQTRVNHVVVLCSNILMTS